MKILLLDGQTVQAISVARSLRDKGHEVSALIDGKLTFGNVSRFINHKVQCPTLLGNEEKYLDFLLSYLDKFSQDVVIPLYNDSAELLSKNKALIESKTGVKCAIPSYETFIRAHDKEKLMDVCKEFDLPHPKTSYINSETVEDAAEYVGFPAMIKPNISSGARGIVLVNSYEELLEKYPNILKEFGRSTLQEYVDHTGTYYNVMMYRDSKGKCHESVILKIMRYFPLKGGTSCYCETINNSKLDEICVKALEVLNWHGFADFDIMERKNGDLLIIEINPRVPASIHGAYISGVNFPQMIVEDAMGELMTTYDNKAGKAMRFMGLDVMWFVFSKDRFSFKP